ncbi:hypothetical protein NH8B_3061 [Pseudogulbenkiania sp. NH8B]|uniref:hypothetical protein n=1 Tax=Pseudogulbenkiania sp. (strain NH8B) TaxID=748280 RepID=UPI0002279F9F|nr:hypothetical protein [Pseudogulbenkiania sp. NH8B]BAK77847.1 hypothetical protein NH8B_3061 [Pseudogulbenkiania sp. NH8B]
MNAAKKIRKYIESGENAEQVQVLKDLAAALELGQSFDLKALYEIDMRYFEAAIELLNDWRFDRRISSRSKLLERLLVETAPEAKVEVPAEAVVAETPAVVAAEPVAPVVVAEVKEVVELKSPKAPKAPRAAKSATNKK